jgi:pseudouridine synthase
MKNKRNNDRAKGDEKIRLHKFIAQSGITSRRKAEQLMAEGRVTVNGRTVTEPGSKINPEEDFVKVDGKPVKPEKKVYIVLNKPDGCVTTSDDEKGRPKVLDIFKHVLRERIYPVGRLDYNTTGCLIMTNDGDWANRITHPKFEVEKEYIAKIQGRLEPETAARLVKGVIIDERRARAKRAGALAKNEKNDIIYIVITEGMYHQVKNMLVAVGLSVVRLKRERVGIVNIKGLAPGQWRYLTEDEIKYFNKGA